MQPIKVLSVFGTLPEAVKMASLVKVLNQIRGASCRTIRY